MKRNHTPFLAASVMMLVIALGFFRYAKESEETRLRPALAVINMDVLNVYGPMKDITAIGYGLSELDRYIEAAAREAGRTVNPDPTPEKGSYFRSDHFPFAKQGIPAVYPSGGTDTVEHGREWTLALNLAMGSDFPNWKEGTDYRAKRDADLAANRR